MTIPSYEKFMGPVLTLLAERNGAALRDAARAVADRLQLSEAQRAEVIGYDGQPTFEARTEQAVRALAHARLVEPSPEAIYLTDRGRAVVADAPSIDRSYLTRFPEFAAHLQEVLSRQGA